LQVDGLVVPGLVELGAPGEQRIRHSQSERADEVIE
jgi:hypothetical protein